MNTSKKILITGANRGLGLGFTKAFLEKDYGVFATCRQPDQAKELQSLKERNPDRLSIVALDIGDESSLKNAFGAVSKETDSLDILLNNAGVYGKKGTTFESLDAQEIEEVFHINTIGPFLVTKTFLPLLEKGKEKKLVHVSSRMGSIDDNTSGGSYPYRISKAALNMLSKNFAWEFKDQGIISTVLHPGWVKTDMGGENARLDIETSIQGMVKVIDELAKENSGAFLNHEGESEPY